MTALHEVNVVVHAWPRTTAYLAISTVLIATLDVVGDHLTREHLVAAAAAVTRGPSMSVFADSASWGLILGILTPLLVSVVQQPTWSPRTRAMVAAVAAVVVGFLTVLANGGLDSGQTLLGVIALVLVASNTAYKTLWKPTGVAPAIEIKTSKSDHTLAA